MRILELFCGTKSMGKAFEALGEVTSLDLVPAFEPTICCSILEWDYKAFPPGHFDFIWASPPCTQYSIARTVGPPRNLAQADSLVGAALDIITYFQPRLGWLMENPATGLLKSRIVIARLPWRDVCYCKYSDGITHRYRKATRLWGKLDAFVPRPMCTKACPCQFLENGAHPTTAQRGPTKRQTSNRFTQTELYSMPKELCDAIVAAVALG